MRPDHDMERVHGSGDVFRDLGLPNPNLEQLRAILAAKIIGMLDDRNLTIRKAQELTGIAAADFSPIRQVKLERFTVDRLGRLRRQAGLVRLQADESGRCSAGVHPAVVTFDYGQA